MTFRFRWAAWITLGTILLGVPLCAALALERTAGTRRAAPIRFRDVRSQTVEFIDYSHSIALTPEQQGLREKVLGNIPAPCCKDYPVETCCCPCNLAKSVWGLSNFLIAKRDARAEDLKGAVLDWLRFVNAKGFSGDACDTAGGCARPFSANGCGGMDEKKLVLASR
ncbi:MAG: hypothetical protein ACRD1B_05790 [Thermoanaerobaculia bacterium]